MPREQWLQRWNIKLRCRGWNWTVKDSYTTPEITELYPKGKMRWQLVFSLRISGQLRADKISLTDQYSQTAPKTLHDISTFWVFSVIFPQGKRSSSNAVLISNTGLQLIMDILSSVLTNPYLYVSMRVHCNQGMSFQFQRHTFEILYRKSMLFPRN